MLVLEVTSMVWLLLMISLDILGFSFLMTRARLLKFSKLSQRELRLNMNYHSSISEVIMVQNSKALISKNFLMNMALLMNYRLLIHRNIMVWSRERIEHLLKG